MCIYIYKVVVILGEKSFGMCSGGVDELCAENSHLCAQLEALQEEPVSYVLHARSHRVRQNP